MQSRNYRGVSRRTTYSFFFHSLDERRFGVSRRRFGEFLLFFNVGCGSSVAFFDFGYNGSHTFVVFRFRSEIGVNGGETLKERRPAACFIGIFARFHRNGSNSVFGRAHLRSDESLVDKFIEIVVISVKESLCLFGSKREVDRTDRFVSVLRVFLGFEIIRFFGYVSVAVFFGYICPCGVLSVFRYPYRVRSDIRYERNVSVFGFDALVKMLRDLHAHGRRHIEF